MIITEIPHFSSKIIRFQVTLKSAVEFTCALEFKISSQQAKMAHFSVLYFIFSE